MPSNSTEILIIGGGVVGSSIAYHLARQGRRVLVVDRSAQVATAPAASWASAGGVRRQGRDPAEAGLAAEAIARWPTLSEELDADLHYRRVGQLLVAENEDETERLSAFVSQQHALGFTDIRLVQGAELHELAPGLAAHVPAGCYSPSDGQADPPRTTRAFAAAAERYGARYLLGTIVQSLTLAGGRIVGARTSAGPIIAEQTILAAGAWSDIPAGTVGLDLPIRAGVYQMLRSTPAPASPLPVLGGLGRRLSLKQLPDGAFLLGGGWPGDAAPDRMDYVTRPESVTGNWADACALLPAVGQTELAEAWCGIEAECFDEIPLIGRAPGLEGLTLALGFSGHGFAIAPAVGRALADQLAGRPTPELDGLRPERTASFDPAAVARFRVGQEANERKLG